MTKISIDNTLTCDILSYEFYQKQKSTMKNYDKTLLTKIIKYIWDKELTDKQRNCFYLVKIRGFKGIDCAAKLGVHQSTVCRHLSAAQKKLDNAFDIYLGRW